MFHVIGCLSYLYNLFYGKNINECSLNIIKNSVAQQRAYTINYKKAAMKIMKTFHTHTSRLVKSFEKL